LPHEHYFDLCETLQSLLAVGVTPILTHPERHRTLCRTPGLLDEALTLGLGMQLTAGSVVGDFGPNAQRAAWHWLECGQVHVIATDAHDVEGRPPRLTAAIDLISARLSHRVARQLFIENPLKVVRGEPLPPLRTAPLRQGVRR
jgi:protein-tyrosine phosphatase